MVAAQGWLRPRTTSLGENNNGEPQPYRRHGDLNKFWAPQDRLSENSCDLTFQADLNGFHRFSICFISFLLISYKIIENIKIL